jgi:hypothetical protein
MNPNGLRPQMSQATGGLLNLTNLASFRRGGSLDPQPAGASRAYGNYVFGAYMSAMGASLSEALNGANWYASTSGASYDADLLTNPNYPAIPAASVINIFKGYLAQQNGTLCQG